MISIVSVDVRLIILWFQTSDNIRIVSYIKYARQTDLDYTLSEKKLQIAVSLLSNELYIITPPRNRGASSNSGK